MHKDKNDIEQIIKQGEDYISKHPEVSKLNADELLEYFEKAEYDLGVNWAVIALVVASSLETSNYEELIAELSALDGADLTKEYIGYLLYSKYGVDIEKVLLLSDKMCVFDKILTYVVSNIVYLNEFQEENILDIALLINSHLRENTVVHSLLLNYATHAINFDKETVVFDRLISVDFEFKNEILSRTSRRWLEKLRDVAVQRLDTLFKTNRKEKIRTALCIIKEAYKKQETVELFYENMSCAGKSFSSLRDIIVAIFTSYVLDAKKENEIYNLILDELRLYSIDNNNKNEFLRAIQYEDEPKEEIIDIFEKIISVPLPNNESFRMVDTIIYNHFKDKRHIVVLDILNKIYSLNRFNCDFDRFAESFSLAIGILPDNDINIWEYIWTEFNKDRSPATIFCMGILLHKFSINVSFIEEVINNNKVISIDQVCDVIGLLQYAFPIGDNVCKLYFDLAPFFSKDIEKFIKWGIDELYSSFPLTFAKIANERKASENNAIKFVSNAIIEHDKDKHLEREAFYKVKDFQPSNEREKTIRKVLIEQNQRIKKLSEEKSVFGMLFKTAHLKYGKRMGFITHFGENSEYSSRTPAALTYECEISKRYLIDPVRYTIDRIKALNEVTEDETDN